MLQRPPSFYRPPQKGQKTQAYLALHLHPNLTPVASKVCARLIWHANSKTGQCDPGQARLRRETGYSRVSVQRALQELDRKGIIDRRLNGHDETTDYRINWDVLHAIVTEFEEQARKTVTSNAPGTKNDATPGTKNDATPGTKNDAQTHGREPTEVNPVPTSSAPRSENAAVASKKKLLTPDTNLEGWISHRRRNISTYGVSELKEINAIAGAIHYDINDEYSQQQHFMAESLANAAQARLIEIEEGEEEPIF